MAQDSSFARRTPYDKTVLNAVCWLLQIALAVFLVVQSAIPLYQGGAYNIETFERIGFGQWFRHFTATVEVAGAIGLLIPALAGLAAMGLVGVMIGAITTELTVRTAAGAVLPAELLVLFALVAWYRWPQTKALPDLARRVLSRRR
ncbi:DoxX family protein [Haloechinothrix halophila]|uniref:DoxX family protein n=1 Tax=Haloechinothrix halophila TaxID=1069073 RepID=UPI000419BED2|nr:DoxX family protein [Haloechinothrix halophila]